MGLLINFKGVCRTAPATPGLLKRRSRGGMRRKGRGGTKEKMERKFKELGKEEGQGNMWTKGEGGVEKHGQSFGWIIFR